MRARDWFEQILADVEELKALEQAIEAAEAQTGPRGQNVGSIGGGGGSRDGMRGIDRIVDAGLREKAERQRAKVNPQVEQALEVLYGRSGRGGLAKERGQLDADILCCHYLQGVEWSRIARDIVRADTEYPTQWCRHRAMRALLLIDKVGPEPLADS